MTKTCVASARHLGKGLQTYMRKHLSRLGAVCLIGAFGAAGAVPVVSSAHVSGHVARHHHGHSHHKQIHHLKKEIKKLKTELNKLESQGRHQGTQIKHLNAKIHRLQSRIRKAERQLKHYKQGCRRYKRTHHYYIPPFCQ